MSNGIKVLIVPDKFKGTLRADEAAAAIAAGWRMVRPQDSLELLPMSDGGDGFGPIIGGLLEAEQFEFRTVNAKHETITTPWWWSESREVAVVESASVIGLAMLPRGRFHPFELDTLGLGQLLKQIGETHPGARLIIGIGGSATNDAGFGMARGLGFRFLDANGACLNRWIALDSLMRVTPPAALPRFAEVLIACDVQNPLLGPQGASRVYGPQKGLRPEDFEVADRAFNRLTEVLDRELGRDARNEPGTGAAGGLGYGLRVFLKGTFEPGFNIFSRLARLTEKIASADLIVTAEGAIDAQTDMGKGTGAIARLAREHRKPCLGLAGQCAGLKDNNESSGFAEILSIVPGLAGLDEAQSRPAHWLEKLSSVAATNAPKLLDPGS